MPVLIKIMPGMRWLRRGAGVRSRPELPGLQLLKELTTTSDEREFE
jgi:hypothetical protein